MVYCIFAKQTRHREQDTGAYKIMCGYYKCVYIHVCYVVVVLPYRWDPIFCDSQACMIPSKVRAASAHKLFTSISSQIRPTHSIHCRGVIHIKWARPRL